MSFLDNDKQPFAVVSSPKFQDEYFLNSFEIDNIEKYLEIKEEDIRELENLCQLEEEADGRTYLKLPLDDSIQFKEIANKLQDSVHFLSRIVSPKKRQKRLGKSYAEDNRTRNAEFNTLTLNENDENEVEKEESPPCLGEDTIMFHEFERILKDFEISAVKNENDNKLMLILEDCKKPGNITRENENKSILGALVNESKLLHLSQLSPVKNRMMSKESPSRKRKNEELIMVQEDVGIERETVKEPEREVEVATVEEKMLSDLNLENSSDLKSSSAPVEKEAIPQEEDKKVKKRKIYIKNSNTGKCNIF